ncbi:MAG: hypothetical protein AB7U27_03985, partial [Aminobacteriaceae bacterium]
GSAVLLQHPIRVRGAAFACHPDGVLFRRIASPEGKDLGLALASHPERMRGVWFLGNPERPRRGWISG